VTQSPDVAAIIAPVAGGCQFVVAVTPRSSVNRLELDTSGALRARLTAPPVEGAANDALLTLLAKVLKLPRSRLAIVSGATSRQKRIAVHDVSPDDLADRLWGALGAGVQR
jgi:uncharacterized protein YggU (UPF0235/DUF167 family)